MVKRSDNVDIPVRKVQEGKTFNSYPGRRYLFEKDKTRKSLLEDHLSSSVPKDSELDDSLLSAVTGDIFSFDGDG